MFTPMVAGVTIPGIALGLLMVAPYVDKNPSHKPSDRKFAICVFTIFLMFWSVLVIEFAATLSCTAFLTIFSALVKAPLLGLADVNQTPNPSKAPWYFLGLQELLTMFTPMVAGVTIPGIALGLLMVAPYVDKNPSHKPTDRKFAICVFTIFLMFWSVLVIIGSFFRGQGFNFTFPWNDHVFFEL